MEQFITTYWSQILVIGGFIWGYSALNSKVKENCRDIKTLQDKDNEIEKRICTKTLAKNVKGLKNI